MKYQIAFAIVSTVAAAYGQQLSIIKAAYGAGKVPRDVTAILAGQISSGQLRVAVSNSKLGGDPIFGQSKILTVRYRTSAGEFVITAREGEKLELPNLRATAVTSEASSGPATAGIPVTTPSPRLAPDGVYWLIQRASAVTDEGIVALPLERWFIVFPRTQTASPFEPKTESKRSFRSHN
jgi:hypothetical protein